MSEFRRFVQKRKKMRMEWLRVQMELSDGWVDVDRVGRWWWKDRKWHKGQEMGGDRNNGALGPVRQNAVPR